MTLMGWNHISPFAREKKNGTDRPLIAMRRGAIKTKCLHQHQVHAVPPSAGADLAHSYTSANMHVECQELLLYLPSSWPLLFPGPSQHSSLTTY